MDVVRQTSNCLQYKLISNHELENSNSSPLSHDLLCCSNKFGFIYTATNHTLYGFDVRTNRQNDYSHFDIDSACFITVFEFEILKIALSFSEKQISVSNQFETKVLSIQDLIIKKSSDNSHSIHTASSVITTAWNRSNDDILGIVTEKNIVLHKNSQISDVIIPIDNVTSIDWSPNISTIFIISVGNQLQIFNHSKCIARSSNYLLRNHQDYGKF
jgi:dimeric dUTPase (all-alpha-NTP-PPase superfamily)